METVKRGYEPKDKLEFGPKAAAKLNAAAQELVFLMDRGYDIKSASTFVGNHHLLSERQRLALARMTSPHAALEERECKRLREAPAALVLDGVFSRMENVVTADAIILDKCGSWFNLNRGLIEEAIPEAWVFRLDKQSMQVLSEENENI